MFKKALALLMLVFVVLFSGCSSVQKISEKKGHKITIGFCMDTLKEERWYKDENDFISQAKKRNAEVLVDVAYDNPSVQLQQVKDMADKGVDVLVIIPSNAQEAAAAVKYAKGRGIKVISYDRLILNAGCDLYISFDNEKVGEMQATAIVKAAGFGKYVIVEGPSSDYNTVLIKTGIMSVLSKYIKSGKIKIIKEIEAKDWMSDEAYNGISGLLKEDVGVNAVIAENDSLAGGIIDALSENRLIPSVPVVGMDADLSACQHVVEGQQLMTVYKPIDKLAAAAAQSAVKLADGEKLENSSYIYDGKYNVPYYKIEPVAVYKGNMYDTVIKDGFHSIGDVYMNVPKSNWPGAFKGKG